MIARVWHGWTTTANADVYEELLRRDIFPGILEKRVEGFVRIELLRRELVGEVEFMTVMWFASQEAITAFAGPDQELAYVPASARGVLARFDQRAAHYEVRHGLNATSQR